MQTKKTILFIPLTILLVIFSYYFIDRQLACIFYAYKARNLPILRNMSAEIVDVIMAFVFLFYIYTGICLARLKPDQINKKLPVMCNAIVISVFLKIAFKLIFSRYSAETFLYNNPSLLNYHFYGFNFFTFNPRLTSFPSGHATVMFSFATSMWFLFPKLRWLCLSLACIVALALVGMYYHFVSDVIAGAALGYFVSLYNYRYWLASK